jgi:hypothetical protein
LLSAAEQPDGNQQKTRCGGPGRMMDFPDLERQVLEDLKDSTHLKAVLEKFCEMKAEECRRACARNMAHVPRDPEVAADYAAKAQAYETFMQDLVHA